MQQARLVAVLVAFAGLVLRLLVLLLLLLGLGNRCILLL